jgi:uncharacterized protein YrrD
MEATELDIPIDAEVQCADGPCGHSTYVVLNPQNDQVTHVVVKDKRRPHAERLIPIDWVVKTTPDTIHLCCTHHELALEDRFIEDDFVPVQIERYVGQAYVAWPFHATETRSVKVKHENLPAGELAVHRGARVAATDGPVGKVDEFVVDSHTDAVTHLLLREGHLWGQRDVSIPVSAIDHLEEDTVYLNLDKRSIEALPSTPVRRR